MSGGTFCTGGQSALPHRNGDPRVNALYTAVWINKFPDVVKGGLGRLKGIVAEIELKGMQLR